jgi:uncharacterized protein
MVPDETNGAVTGLDVAELSQLQTLFSSYPEISKVILFGSRAKGTARKNSDIDLAVDGLESPLKIESLAMELDELPLPYRFDLQAIITIKNRSLLEHIDRVGVLIYQCQTNYSTK